MNHNRNSAVAIAAAAFALVTVTAGLTFQPTRGAAESVVVPFPVNEATRDDLPESERALLSQMRKAGLIVRDQFT